MRVQATRLPGLIAVEPAVHADERGFFCETYRGQWHAELGLPAEQQFVQDNHSRSSRGVVRGMHFHVGEGVAKLVRCARGRILDVAVDLRRGSPTYARWEAVELDDQSMRELYLPVGFAHGFCVLSEVAEVEYKCTDFYDRADEIGARWDSAGIEWPIEHPLLSPKDAALPTLAELRKSLAASP